MVARSDRTVSTHYLVARDTVENGQTMDALTDMFTALFNATAPAGSVLRETTRGIGDDIASVRANQQILYVGYKYTKGPDDEPVAEIRLIRSFPASEWIQFPRVSTSGTVGLKITTVGEYASAETWMWEAVRLYNRSRREAYETAEHAVRSIAAHITQPTVLILPDGVSEEECVQLTNEATGDADLVVVNQSWWDQVGNDPEYHHRVIVTHGDARPAPRPMSRTIAADILSAFKEYHP